MYILFIDESGTPKLNTDTAFFVLCGILIDSNNWIEINNGLSKIKNNHNMTDDREIKWRYFSPSNRDKDNPFPYYNNELRESCRNTIYDFLLTDKIEKIIYTAIDLSSVKYIGENVEKGLIHKDAYALLFHELYKTINESNDKDAMIICDNITDDKNKTIHELMRNHHMSINHNYTNFSKRITNELFISDSRHSAGIQFADMAAGAISFKYNNPQYLEKHCFYNKIKPKLITIESGTNYNYCNEDDAELE